MPTARTSIGADTALLVLMPDAMVEELWSPLDRRLRPLRLEVLATTAVMLRPPLMAELYARGTVKPRPGQGGRSSSWLSYDLGLLDMAIPAVVRTPHTVDLAALLDAWKGPSSFFGRRSGDLRAVLPSSHRCFSVMHTPDDTDQTALDIERLFGAATLRAIGAPACAPRCTLPDLRRLRMPAPRRAALHPYEIVRRCLVRATALLAYDHLLQRSEAWLALAASCADHFAQSPPTGHLAVRAWWTRRAEEFTAQLPTAPLPAEGREHTEIRSRLDLHRALRLMLDPAAYGPDSCLAVERALDANDLFLDPWERHELRIALSFHQP